MTLSQNERDDVANTLLEIAREAAELLRAGLGGAIDVEHKGAIDLVTPFDRASEALLRARFRQSSITAPRTGTLRAAPHELTKHSLCDPSAGGGALGS